MGVLICSILTKKFQKFREINREVIHDHESANIIFVILAGKKRIESATDFSFFFGKTLPESQISSLHMLQKLC